MARSRVRNVAMWCEWTAADPIRASYFFTTRDQFIDAWNGSSWKVKRALILARDGHRCLYCGKSAAHVDHTHPRAHGGGDEWWNLVAACSYCNLGKHARVEDWVADWQRSMADRAAAWADGHQELFA